MDRAEPTPPRVTEADREAFRRLGEWKRASHEAARERDLSFSARDRLLRSMAMARYATNVDRSRPDDEPWKLWERAKALGLARRE